MSILSFVLFLVFRSFYNYISHITVLPVPFLLFLCGLLLTERVCRTLRPVSGENGTLDIEVPDIGCGLSDTNKSLWPGLPLDGWLLWPTSINRLVVFDVILD